MATRINIPSRRDPTPIAPPESPPPGGDSPETRLQRSMTQGFKWLYPGLRIKRWLALIPLGILLVIVGVMVLANIQTLNYLDRMADWLYRTSHLSLDRPAVYVPLGLSLLAFGLGTVFFALVAVNRSIVGVLAPESLGDLPSVLHRKRALSHGPRIVVVGGGTGLSTLLRGLKQYTGNLTAVVTMTDDGGSSGLLQKQMPGRMLPPGDIRNCLVALADAEPLMQQLFQYRFATNDAKDGLSGHSFGNLLIAAMADITGDFERAVEETSKVLAIRGRVLPSTVESVVLVGEMEDGREVTGETNIATDPARIDRIRLCPDTPRALPEAVKAIAQADIVLMGPGSVFTSVIPNLLVQEIAEALSKAKALKVYVCNVMTQPGETDGYTASQHVAAIEEHAGVRVFDYVLVNTARPSGEMMARYTKTGAEFVDPDLGAITQQGYTVVKGAFISETAVVRHDPDRLAHAILKLWQERAPLFSSK
ncbi:MAG TPA: gluconeogenesis factor YvcK family protein [Armatimonadaceae bacterium]|nr:gluconeogenesis factor YvcK family protein [Armatimonadaceae bacterium]